MKFCVYLTTYCGNKLPPFYIGSTSIKRVEAGYRGSVNSRCYGIIWKQEQKANPSLFKTTILTKHETRKEAILKERYFHDAFRVHLSPMYINLNLASPNGICGVILYGKDNPAYGKKRPDFSKWIKENRHLQKYTEERRQKVSEQMKGEKNIMFGKTHTSEAREKIRARATGRVYKKIQCSFCEKVIGSNNRHFHFDNCKDNPNRVRVIKHKKLRTLEMRKATSNRMKAMSKLVCPHCGISATKSNATRWHFDNCRFIPTLQSLQTDLS